MQKQKQNPEPRTVSLTTEINLFAKNNHTFQCYSNQTKRIDSYTDASNRKSKCREKTKFGDLHKISENPN